MMRTFSPVWLALSLAANAVLIVVCLPRPTEAPSRISDAASRPETSRAKTTGTVDVSGLDPEIVTRIGAGDEATLRDLLLACGLEPKAVRECVAAAVSRRFEAERVAAMMRQRGKGWWKERPDWWSYPEREEIEARQIAAIDQLLGALPQEEYPWATERWNFLPEEKRKKLGALDRDYAELERKLPPQPWLPREREMYSTLKDEKRRDLETALSREELDEYDFREKAESFARDLNPYGINEAELRALWQATQAREAEMDTLTTRYGKRDPFAAQDGSWPPEAREAEDRLNEAYDARRREIIGEERIARGNREADESFQRMMKVAKKLRLGREQVEAAYAVLERAQEIVETEHPNKNEKARLREAAWAEIGEQVSADALTLMKEAIGFRHYWLKPTAE